MHTYIHTFIWAAFASVLPSIAFGSALAAAPTLIPFNGLIGADVEVEVEVEVGGLVVLAEAGEPNPRYPLFLGGALL